MATAPYEKTTLPNGVRLILIPMAGVESVATSVMVAVGSRYETPAINGVSHFLEHMVFKGTKKYPTTDDVNVIERAGGLQNAYTDIDITSFHNKVLDTDWELALDVNRELALAPLLEEVYIERERDVILEEMKRYEDEPAAKVWETFHKMMYPGAPLGMRIIGEVQSLRDTDSQIIRRYHDVWYTPNRIVVALAGKVESKRGNITRYVTDQFGDLSSTSGADFLPLPAITQTKPRLEVVTKPDAQQAHLTLGIRTFRRASNERFAWALFNLIMGISFTSRLFKEIREKRGLCYHIRSNSENWADVGHWSIYAGVATEKVEEAVKAIMGELAASADNGVTDDEVVIAKKRLKTWLAFRAEDPEFMGEYYGRQELFREPIVSISDYIKKIDTISKEDINVLARKYLITNHLNMAIVWSKPKDENLLNLLHLS
jgi:predicted Zn-dependent peptidase